MVKWQVIVKTTGEHLFVKMTSSYLDNKISDLEARLRAENEANRNDTFPRDGQNPFSSSRPGSGRSRPKMLGDMASQTRPKKQPFEFPGSNYNQEQSTTDPIEVDSKIKEIMKLTGIICINGKKYRTDISDLEHLGELGNGTCGHVVKMLHRPSQAVVAVKQMRRSGNLEENKRIIMDLEVVLKSHDCNYIVKCLGCFITDADVWICMELMATCFDKLLKKLNSPIPEDILGRVTLATVNALHYLKENHGVIHRDVKPSNILLDERGNVKLCDFGISGRLVDSKAKTKNAGCAAYMAPERISPPDPGKPAYDIRADVWSLGITLVELATGAFPYPNCASDFDVLCRVLQDDPPLLPKNNFSPEFQDFVRLCLAKDFEKRPKYKELLCHPFLKRYETKFVDVASWFAHATQTSRSRFFQPRKRSVLLRSLSDKGKSSDLVYGSEYPNSTVPREETRFSCSQPRADCEGIKGVWNAILKSPLFSRKKKTTEIAPQPQLQQNNYCNSTSSNMSPLVLQRFIHQQIQHMNGLQRSHRSTSVSPTRHYREPKAFEENFCSEMKNLKIGNPRSPGSRNNPSPSPEPPPRINKMVSPLLMRRIAYNNIAPSEMSHSSIFTLSSSPRRFHYGIPPQPPPRRKQPESRSVPCSPIPYHRIPVTPNTLWNNCDVFNSTQ